MTKRNVYDANGHFLRVLGEDEIIKDGERVRFEMNLMDSSDPRQRIMTQDSSTPGPMRAPGFVQVADGDYAERERRFFDHKERLSKAWEHAPALDASAAVMKPAIPAALNARDARDDALDKRDVELTEAWRHA